MLTAWIILTVTMCDAITMFVFIPAGKIEFEGVDASPTISTQPPELGMLYNSLELFEFFTI